MRIIIILLLLLSIVTTAYAYQVFRWNDADGQPHVMRCEDNGNCTIIQ